MSGKLIVIRNDQIFLRLISRTTNSIANYHTQSDDQPSRELHLLWDFPDYGLFI